jgi:hypothetical protein
LLTGSSLLNWSGLFFYTKRYSPPSSVLICVMNLHSIIFGENDAFLRGREATVEGKPLDTQKTTTHIVPEKYREDVAALTKYIGEERFQKGLSIEVSLAEILNIAPRTRRRTDAYDSLAKYLKSELDITLTIKSQKS